MLRGILLIAQALLERGINILDASFGFLAAERRQSLATAERPWIRFPASAEAAVAAKDSFAALRLIAFCNENHGFRPWLSSAAAPRLEIAEGFFKYIDAFEEEGRISGQPPGLIFPILKRSSIYCCP